MFYLEDMAGFLVLLLLVAAGAGVYGYLTLTARIDILERHLKQLSEEMASMGPLSPWARPPTPEVPSTHPSSSPGKGTGEDATGAEGRPAKTGSQSPMTERPVSAPNVSGSNVSQPAGPQTASPPTGGGLEQTLASRWLIWLGGAALAAAGIFLGQYVIEQGLIGPLTRMLLGILAGIGLVVAGEWLTRHPPLRAIGTISPQYIPAALSAGGVVTAFSSAYAGYALANLMPAWMAFIILAAIANGAVGLSLRQGSLLAAIGLTGAYVMPVLVSTGSHQPWVLFPYLFLVTVSGLTVVGHLAWRWLGWLCLVGAYGWVLLWLPTSWIATDIGPVGLYLALIMASVDVLQRGGRPLVVSPADRFYAILRWRQRDGFLVSAVFLTLVCLFIMLRLEDYGLPVWAVFTAFILHALWVAWKRPALEILVPVAGIASLYALAVWHIPHLIELVPPTMPADALSMQLYKPVIPPALEPFLGALSFFGLLFLVVGAAGGRMARTPWLWAAVGVALALVLLVLGEHRFSRRGLELAWSLPALVLAGVFGLLARDALSVRRRPGGDATLAMYLLGVFGAIAFALTLHLDRSWLGVALTLLAAASAWTGQTLSLPHLRPLAMIFTVVAMAWLLGNADLHGLRGDWRGVAWLAYMYGVPAMALSYAARRMIVHRDDTIALIVRLSGGACIMLLLSLGLRLLVADGIFKEYTLLEAGLQTATWCSACLRLHYRQRLVPDRLVDFAWKLFAGLAAANLVFYQLLALNPMHTNESVGSWPVVNVLLVAYALSAAMAVLLYGAFARSGRVWLSPLAGASGLILAFIWLNLEVRHWFHGAHLAGGGASVAELFTYSLAWLAFGGALLVLGLWRNMVILRWISLAVVLLTVGKVFLFDLSELTGLYRVFSFFGLGLCLVGIGYLYQRFVFPRSSPPSQQQPPQQPLAQQVAGGPRRGEEA